MASVVCAVVRKPLHGPKVAVSWTYTMNLLVIDPLQLSPVALQALADAANNSHTRLASPSSVAYMMLESPVSKVLLHDSLSESQREAVRRACLAVSPDVPVLNPTSDSSDPEISES